MEYLGRLGLVSRKNKERGRSRSQVVPGSKETRGYAAESEGDTSCNSPREPIDLKSSVMNAPSSLPASETGFTTQRLAESRANMPTGQYFPKSRTSWGQDAFVDMEYLQYEQHVQARARELAKAESFTPGGRHAWKTLIFWKRHTRLSSSVRAFVRAASSSNPKPFQTPFHGAMTSTSTTSTTTPGRGYWNGARRGSSTPLYTDEFPTASGGAQFATSIRHLQRRSWCEPVRGGKVIMPRDDECNMSPYVPLSDRTQRCRSASGPLYLV